MILRAEIVWSKPNGLPESVTDRVRRSHEQWFHLVRQPRYYSAVDEIREPPAPQRGLAGTFRRPKPSRTLVPGQAATQHRADRPDIPAYHPLGKLPGSVWAIPTEPLKVPPHVAHARCCAGQDPDCRQYLAHYAAFPAEWPRRIVTGWSPPGICVECGEGRRPTAKSSRTLDGQPVKGLGGWKHGGVQIETAGIGNWRFGTKRVITGYACACSHPTAPTHPAVVLDPCGGTGTTALVAAVLGWIGINVDRPADYCHLAQWRTNNTTQQAKVRRRLTGRDRR